MPKIRLFFKENFSQNKPIILDNDKYHYLKNVMRKKTNDKIFIFNENEEWSGRLKLEVEKKIVPELFISCLLSFQNRSGSKPLGIKATLSE